MCRQRSAPTNFPSHLRPHIQAPTVQDKKGEASRPVHLSPTQPQSLHSGPTRHQQWHKDFPPSLAPARWEVDVQVEDQLRELIPRACIQQVRRPESPWPLEVWAWVGALV